MDLVNKMLLNAKDTGLKRITSNKKFRQIYLFIHSFID